MPWEIAKVESIGVRICGFAAFHLATLSFGGRKSGSVWRPAIELGEEQNNENKKGKGVSDELPREVRI